MYNPRSQLCAQLSGHSFMLHKRITSFSANSISLQPTNECAYLYGLENRSRTMNQSSINRSSQANPALFLCTVLTRQHTLQFSAIGISLLQANEYALPSSFINSDVNTLNSVEPVFIFCLIQSKPGLTTTR
ncbi:hypothetical protein Ddc_18646 [Ditylenchus destructor]|nr:hypothetical protein Ddc_18646 [Ditylenchus destructor]